MIRSLYQQIDLEIQENIPSAAYAQALKNSQGVLWVDICAEPTDVTETLLRETFGFHPLAIADALEETHVPKVDDWDAYLTIVVSAVDPTLDLEEAVETQEIDIFLGQNYLVTYHATPIPAIDRIWKKSLIKSGATHLFYRVIDEIANDYIALADQIDDAINDIEDQLFANTESDLLENIFALKRDLLHLRRIIAPQRDLVRHLSRVDYAVINADYQIYFRDVYDHFLRLYDIIENLRDLVSSALEIYLSVVNNRMNNVMKTLTIITTLFMPISFLTGFFGMNFFRPVEKLDLWTSLPMFSILVLATIIFPVSMFIWMRKRGWTQL